MAAGGFDKQMTNHLKKLDACFSAIYWVEANAVTIQDAWQKCRKPAWLIWYAVRIETEPSKVTLSLCECFRFFMKTFDQYTSVLPNGDYFKYCLTVLEKYSQNGDARMLPEIHHIGRVNDENGYNRSYPLFLRSIYFALNGICTHIRATRGDKQPHLLNTSNTASGVIAWLDHAVADGILANVRRSIPNFWEEIHWTYAEIIHKHIPTIPEITK